MKARNFMLTAFWIVFSTFQGIAQFTTTLTFDESDIIFDTIDGYIQPRLEDCQYTSLVGAPRMPLIIKQYILPLNAEITGITFSDTIHYSLSGSYLVYPAQMPAILDGRPAPEFVPPDSTYYSSNARYSGELIDIQYVTNYSGYYLARLYIYPLQYIASDLELLLFSSISFSIDYQITGNDSLIKKMSTKQYNEIYYDLINTVDNPDSINSYGPICKEIIPPPEGNRPLNLFFLPGAEGDVIEYLIITNDELKPSFEVLAEWKTSKGIPSMVVTTSQVIDHYPGCDLAEKIFNYLKDIRTNWGEIYVLLGGDTEIIPPRYGSLECYEGNCYQRTTDLYYSDVEKPEDEDYNWNENGNCYFWDEDDKLDLNPDLCLGRAPVNTIQEANNFVDKVLTYEQTKFQSQTKKITLIGAHLSRCWDQYNPGDADGMKRWMNPVFDNHIPSTHQSSTIRIYDKDIPDWGQDYYLNKDIVLKALKGEGEGYNHGVQHVFAHTDHSGFSSLGTSQKCNNSRIYIQDLDETGMSTGDILKIMYSGGCEPNMFDKDCIAEHFMNGLGTENNYGIGIGFIGNSGFGYSDAFHQCQGFFDALYIDKKIKLGRIFKQTQISMLDGNHFYRRNLNFLGDPELPVWTTTLADLAIQVNPSTLLIGHNTLEVIVDGLLYEEEAIVCIMKEEEVYGVKETVGHSITFDCVPDTEEEMIITATAPNHLYAQTTIQVNENPGVHLFVDGFNPQNLFLNRGTNSFKIELRNSGETNATNISASLLSDSPYITELNDDPIDFPNIDQGESQESSLEYGLALNLNTPDLVFIPLTLSIQSTQGNFTEEFFLQVKTSQIEYRGNKITWTSDEENDIFAEAGEDVHFKIELFNSGSVQAIIDQIDIFEPPENDFITILDYEASFPDPIESLDNAWCTGLFKVKMDDELGIFNLFPVKLVLNDLQGKEYEYIIKINNTTKPNNINFYSDYNSITLTWNRQSSDEGYNIYKLDPDDLPPGGDIDDSTLYERLNLHVNQFSTYTDVNVEPATFYYYKIACYKDGLPQGPFTTAFKAWTQIPSLEPWPIFVPNYGSKSEGAPMISDAVKKIDGVDHPDLEIFVPMDDGTDMGSSSKTALYAFYANGEELYNINNNITNYAGFVNYETTGIKATPVVGNISDDGNDYDEVAFATTGGEGDHAVSAFLYSAGDLGDLPFPIYPEDGVNLGQPVKGAVVAAPLSLSSPEDVKLVFVEYYDGKIDVKDADGTGGSCIGWPLWINNGDVGACNGIPVVADIDLDTYNEILIGYPDDEGIYALTYDGNVIGGGSFFSPQANPNETPIGMDCRLVVVELDQSDKPEIVLLYAYFDNLSEKNMGRIFALNHDGSSANNWGYDQHVIDLSEDASEAHAYPALSAADLNGDGMVEIIIADAGFIYAWKYNGEPFNDHFPIEVEGLVCPYIAPLVGNVDADPEQEIIVASNSVEDFICAVNLDGSMVPGWPLVVDGLHTTPALGDVNYDGLNEVVAAYGGYINVWKTTGETGYDQWPLYRQNSFNNAVYQSPACDYSPNNPLYVSANDTWSDYRIMNCDIIIEPGVELTLTGRVTLPDESKIVVQRGATLKVTGGVITSACGGLWQGIQVWGYSDKSQFDPSFPPGKVEISEGALIENASIGIATIKSENGSNDDDYTGGIVWCEGSTFLNNVYAIRFYNYRNFNPSQPEYEVANRGYIKNCTFETNGHLPGYGTFPFAFVRMDDVSGISFSGIHFINSCGEQYPWTQKGVGIESHNTAYFLDEYCYNETAPCDSSRRNFFHNMYYGIRSFGQGRENRSITVMNADFHLNQNGLFISNINNARIIFNNFTIPEKSFGGELERYGLYTEFCSGYTIEENTFVGHNNGEFEGNIGMYISNSLSEPNMIYRNDFEDLAYGIVAYGRNRSETGEGLCLKCNNFKLCMNDIHVVPEQDPQGRWTQGSKQGIAAQQGENLSLDTSPAGNDFTKFEDLPTAFNYFNHEDCNMIDYYRHQYHPITVKIEPDPYSEEMISLEEVLDTDYEDKDHACPSNFGSGGIDPGIEKSTIASENIQIGLYSDSIQTLKDGGDTYTLDMDVNTSIPSEAEQVRQQLLGESPYLSDTVMKSAIFKEDVLPNAMIRDVMVANPQSAKSTEILDKLNDREDPMPEEMLGEIMEGRDTKGALEVLEEKLASHLTKKYESLHKLEHYYKQDTVDVQGSLDSLINLWSEQSDPDVLYKLAFMYLYNTDSSNCFSTMNMIPQLTNLSDEQLLNYNDYTTLINILWQVISDTLSIDSTTATQLENLTTRESKPGSLARNILIANGLVAYYEPLILSDNLKCDLVIPGKPNATELNKNRLSVFPNPAKDYIIVSYDLEGIEGKFSIVIHTMDGRPCYRNILRSSKNQIVINTSSFSSGIYNIHLENAGEIIEAARFIISK